MDLNIRSGSTKILGFGFEIQYVARRLNHATNALSRRLDLVECAFMVTPQWRDWEKLRAEVESDDLLACIRKDLSQDISTYVGFTLRNGLLLYKDRLVVPHSSSFIPLILVKFHSSPVGGHSGEIKTYQRIASKLYYWVGMKSDIAKFVAECDICQCKKSSITSPTGLLQPIPLPLRFGPK